jgi:uncharacterized protein YlzI (FlbEa/FlbD family)
MKPEFIEFPLRGKNSTVYLNKSYISEIRKDDEDTACVVMLNGDCYFIALPQKEVLKRLMETKDED